MNALATADAYDDGVVFVDGDYVISQTGQSKTIDVTASVEGVLDAWIDWDHNGVWDPSEKLAFRDADGNAVATIQAGANELIFDVPAGLADSGDFSTYVRFRFSTTGLLSDGSPMQPTGEALDGEVEDYRITVISTPTDWGDAPEPYPTTAADDGARHAISPDALYLGETVTLDLEPHVNLTATGDLDDGFDFSSVSLIPGRDTEMTYQVANDTGAQAYLNAWIDFNADGDWADDGEQIAADLMVDPGENTLTISVPAAALAGATFARFRLSTEQGLSFTGPASDGEVEDYQVTILPTPGQIQGAVWNDMDGNGIHGSAEPGLEGWKIYIDANGNNIWDDGERWTTSDANGAYVFDELSPGEYNIREVLTHGWRQTGTESYHVTVGPGEVLFARDFLNQDDTPPEILLLQRNADSPSNAAEVTYHVTFSEPVTGVDESDFNLVIVDGVLTGAKISGISGSGAEYTLTVTTGEGEGTLRVDLVNDLSIQDLTGYALGYPAEGDTFHGQTYQIDRTAPTVVSIVQNDTTPTNASTVFYTVTFSENVAGVDIGDFDLEIGGDLTGAAISEITGEDAVYYVSITTGTGDGSLGLKLVDNDSIHDIAGNALVGDGVEDGSLSGPAYDIDHTAPTVDSIARAGASPTSATSLVFTVTFSEDVQGVNSSDFTLVSTMTGSSLYSVTGSGDTYTVTVLSGAGDAGTVGLNLSDNDSIHDLAGNKLGGDGVNNGDFTGEVYEINRTSPTALLLSNSRVVEHLPVNTVVGALTSTGPHAGLYTYALVSGEGDADNGSFRIVGDMLRTTAVFDYAAKSEYSVRLRTTDSAGFTLEAEYTIAVVPEASALAVGNLVWKDDGDGIQESGEPGVPGTTVTIFCSPTGVIGGANDYIYGQTVTDSAGNYTLDNLLSGLKYYLVFRSPTGYTFTTANFGDDALDSDAVASGANLGTTALFTLTASTNDLDAGLLGSAAAYDFAIRDGSSGDDVGQAVATDAQGNVYMVGSFSGAVDFDPGVGVYTLTSAGGTDVFVAKYSSSGSLLWVRALGGYYDDAAMSVSVGTDGLVTVAGSFQGTVDFLAGPAEYKLTAAGAKDAFVMKIDSLGGLVWARGMGGAGDEVANDVAVGSDGSIYSIGYFATAATGTNVDFDPGAGVYNLTSIGPKDVFVSKLDANGNFVWAKRMGGTGWSQGMSIGSGIAVTADGSVYTTGNFQGTADFDPSANQFTLTCQGDTDVFLSKLTADGQFVWAKRIGNSSEDYGADLAVSSLDGSVYLTGGFQGVVDFDPGVAIFNLDSGGNRSLFAARYTSAGQFVWADGFGGNGWNLAGDIAIDASGNAYVTGGFWGIASFNTGAGTYTISSLGEKDAFVLKLNSAGGFISATSAGSAGDDSGNGIALSTFGAVYTTGYFTNTADFDPSSALYNLTSAGGRDAFLAKYADSSPVTPLTVTINQKTGQADPATAGPINFTVVFSAAVTDFTTGDVTLSGTAPGTLSAIVTGSGTTYNVAVSGMTGSGTIIASIAAGKAQNSLGTPNQASTSTDNSVMYNVPGSGPQITNVVLTEAGKGSDLDGVMESTDRLLITWGESSSAAITSWSLKIDDKPISGVGHPNASSSYCVFGPLAAGNHTYTIELTDASGGYVKYEQPFDVAAVPVPPGPPVIAKMVVTEATKGSDHDGVLETSDRVLVTWHVASSAGIASRSFKINGTSVVPSIGGPNATDDYYASFGPLAAGTYTYTIDVTDTGGLTNSQTGQFIVVGASAAPIVSHIVVTEAVNGSNHNGGLDTADRVLITWNASSTAGIAGQSMTIDNNIVASIGGPNATGDYYSPFGPLGEGKHSYTIKTTDNAGRSSSLTGTFQIVAALTVAADSPPSASAPSISDADLGSIVTEATSAT